MYANCGPCAVQAPPNVTANQSMLGSTIQEKTRHILGWNGSGGMVNPSFSDRRQREPVRSHPYNAQMRKSSMPSPVGIHGSEPQYYRQITPPPSPQVIGHNYAKSRVTVGNSNVHPQYTQVSSPSQNVTIGYLPISPQSPSYHVASSPHPSQIVGQHGVPHVSQHRVPPPHGYSQQITPCYGPSSSMYPMNGVQGMPMQPISTETINRQQLAKAAIDRLRETIPNLSTDRARHLALMQTVNHVIDLQMKVEKVKNECMLMENLLAKKKATSSKPLASPTNTESSNSPVPDDLVSIDISHFKSLDMDPNAFPLDFDCISEQDVFSCISDSPVDNCLHFK